MRIFKKQNYWRHLGYMVIMALMMKLLQPALVMARTILLSDKQVETVAKIHGPDAAIRLQEWRELVQYNQNKNHEEKIELVNRFFNRLDFVEDKIHWGKTDYWATPVEFLTTKGGDCEDFAIAKYFTLRELGVPTNTLRITYVKALTINQAHMVLAYYKKADAEPLVLDNIDKEIKPASQRNDLVPVYSFNGDNLWLSKELEGRGKLVGNADRIGLWKTLLRKIKKEFQETY
jgi:predicted transglutaminase-like cysteine proteinase